MIKLCCKDVSINNFQWQSCSYKCLVGNREKDFEIDAYLRFNTTISVHGLSMALCYKRCISETAALIGNGLLYGPGASLFGAEAQ